MRAPLRARLLATAGVPGVGLAELAIREFNAGVCTGRVLLASLRRDTGNPAGARQLVGPALLQARQDAADADTVRCGALAAAAMNDADALGELLQRIAAREDFLRYWALPIAADRGPTMLRGRYYPGTGSSTTVQLRRRASKSMPPTRANERSRARRWRVSRSAKASAERRTPA